LIRQALKAGWTARKTPILSTIPTAALSSRRWLEHP
jgi:hypothetical protein